MIGAFLPVLIEVYHFLNRCKNVCLSLVQQLSSVLSERDAFYNEEVNSHTKPVLNPNALLSTHLFSVFTAVGDLLSVLQLFDSIIRNNEQLRESWFLYKKLVETAKSDLNGFQTTIGEISQIEKSLLSVDASLMRGKQLFTTVDCADEQGGLSVLILFYIHYP